MIPIPAWPTFAEAARVAGGTPVFVPTHVKDGFRVTASAVARKVGPKTRAVMVNSPSNPTGAVIEPAELLKLARLAKQKGFWLLYDDTYAHLTFGNGGPQALQYLTQGHAETVEADRRLQPGVRGENVSRSGGGGTRGGAGHGRRTIGRSRREEETEYSEGAHGGLKRLVGGVE